MRRALALSVCLLAAASDRRPGARWAALGLLVIFDDLSADIGLGGVARTPVSSGWPRGRRFDPRTDSTLSESQPNVLFSVAAERTGVWGNLRRPAQWVRRAVLLQDHFARNGYYTARVGKVYHSRFEGEFHWSEVVDTYGSASDEEEGIELGEVVERRGALSGRRRPRNAAAHPDHAARPAGLPRARHPEAPRPLVLPSATCGLRAAASSLPATTDALPLHAGADAAIPPSVAEAVAAYREPSPMPTSGSAPCSTPLRRPAPWTTPWSSRSSTTASTSAITGTSARRRCSRPRLRVPLVITGPGLRDPASPRLPSPSSSMCTDPPGPVRPAAGRRPRRGGLRPVLQDPERSVKDRRRAC